MAPRYGSGARPVAGRCRRCGTTLGDRHAVSGRLAAADATHRIRSVLSVAPTRRAASGTTIRAGSARRTVLTRRWGSCHARAARAVLAALARLPRGLRPGDVRRRGRWATCTSRSCPTASAGPPGRACARATAPSSSRCSAPRRRGRRAPGRSGSSRSTSMAPASRRSASATPRSAAAGALSGAAARELPVAVRGRRVVPSSASASAWRRASRSRRG